MSIRWRLVLSYIGLSLLAVLTLGTVLYNILRTYYTGLERSYLQTNAVMISQDLVQSFTHTEDSTGTDMILKNYAYLTRTRVRIFDPNMKLIGDSGEWSKLQARMAMISMGSVAESGTGDNIASIIVIESDPSTFIGVPVDMNTMSYSIVEEGTPAEVITGPYYVYSASMDDVLTARNISHEQVIASVYAADGSIFGYVELSEGPAYGQEILTSVLSGWAASGLIAVLVAAAVGWFVSRRFSDPLRELTEVTRKMSRGDLTARAKQMNTAEYRTLAESFNEMADRMEKTIGVLRRFAADAAHELQTPLTALRTNLELAQVETSNPEVSGSECDKYLEASLEQTDRMNHLAGNLLDLSRLEAGSTTEEAALVNLNLLIQTSGEIYASAAEQKGIDFSMSVPEEEPLLTWCKERQIQRALHNLLDNALKFTPAGGKVTLGIQREDERVWLWVEDSGIGIDEDEIDNLFERFHRGRNASGYPGSGLGLAIVRSIAETHGAGVEAGTLPGSGARFSMWLPLGDHTGL